MSFLEIRAEVAKSPFLWNLVLLPFFAFKHHVSAAHVIVLLTIA